VTHGTHSCLYASGLDVGLRRARRASEDTRECSRNEPSFH
jgi:hypothetical protein